ncbi:DUF6415 family natural product biosynthesis protein [Streptomyces sp. NPDC090106]|uniref:DUF6415 family natural product biosynthesis protein n=1 Tax=Streptomyces sp. NPDC090106 TaxID=3365946 RepID=UPI00380C8BDF
MGGRGDNGTAPGGSTAQVDADTIRRTYDVVLWAWDTLPADDREQCEALLVGHVGLLMGEVDALVPRMGEEYRHTAEHVLNRSRRALTRTTLITAKERAAHVGDLATLCRALLSLHQRPGPLLGPAARDGAS